MKKVLLDENLSYYRANLHCHSTLSDGRKTPEELKEFYMSRGYSAIAYTDHNKFVTHNDLTDDKFVALSGIEYNLQTDKWSNRMKTCHLCMVAPSPDIEVGPVDKVGEYTHAGVNEVLWKGRDAGFFVTYNHPVWSLESYPDYSGYEGMNAMELVNYGCVTEGYEDVNKQPYTDLLNQGKRVLAVATDDNHNVFPDDNARNDSFGGYVMLNAAKLDYASLFEALMSGSFYCARGDHFNDAPEIKSLIFEDGNVTVKCSNARCIQLVTGTRGSKPAHAERGKYITEATFPTHADEDWFRVVVTDENGFEAYSNAYFLADLK